MNFEAAYSPLQEPEPIDVRAEIAAALGWLPKMPGVIDIALIGSALYLPDARDVDFAVLIDPCFTAIEYVSALENGGWGRCHEYDGTGGVWAAVRRGNLNLMVIHDPKFFAGYKTAMEVCKALNLTQKIDRIAVCQIVRDGKTADEVVTSRRPPPPLPPPGAAL